MKVEHFYIDGGWRPSHYKTAPLEPRSPVTEEPLGQAPVGGGDDVAAAVAAARRAFPEWSAATVGEREAFMVRLRSWYAATAPDMAKMITWEMGSPVWFAAQTDHPLAIMDYYLDARHPTFRTEPGAVVEYAPVGVVGIITPWNMPQKTILMKAIPALLAGCTVVVKPAQETPFDALELARLVHQSGFPAGVFNVVTGDDTTGEYLTSHPWVDKIAFTGSTNAGRAVALECAHRLGRVSLELGGKSAMILLDDAQLDLITPEVILRDCLLNSGQICSNQTRILAPRSRLAEVTDALTAAFRSYVVGDPSDPATHIGPLVTRQQQGAVRGYIQRAANARVLFETEVPATGWYVSPTLLLAEPETEIAEHEVFGPVVCLIGYDGDDEAVKIANSTVYGLDGSVWSADTARAAAVASRLRTGTVRINGAEPGIHLPLGGFKWSGIGRELGLEGLRAFQEVRVVTSA